MFRSMVRFGPKLQRRQVLLGRFMDIGTELFVMSAVCAYTETPAAQRADTVALAEVYCRSARRRILEYFRGRADREQRRANTLAEDVLDGRFLWLEDGIIEAPGAAAAADGAFEPVPMRMTGTDSVPR